ncbi:MAG TPA: hypothetical protein VLG11_00650 [Candidatus Saccharimonadales bacterium]|nr:hypothetical protein [Candidatus Saccharimonadales bacterium]
MKFFVAAACLAVGAVVAAGIWLRPAGSPLPASVMRTVTFALYYPDKSWRTEATQATYTNGVVALTTQKAGITLSVTEQATPPVFGDVPQYYPSLLAKMNEYASFNSALGTVYLTKPTELGGNQTAVLNGNGTLLFVRPSTALTTGGWQQFFGSLRAVH